MPLAMVLPTQPADFQSLIAAHRGIILKVALGLPAVLPPPEEVKQVETAIGASRAEQARDSMLRQ